MVAIVEYGVGNLFSLCSSLAKLGVAAEVTADKAVISRASSIILPGVGAFGDASALLRESGLDEVVKNEALAGKPLMGICLGMQLLFEESHEFGIYPGLGLLKGKILPIAPKIPESYKIPHIGWNPLSIKKESPLFKNIKNGDAVYFVHSYYASDCAENTIATTEYFAELTAAAAKGNVYGTQFHPEKSGDAGLRLLKAFSEL